MTTALIVGTIENEAAVVVNNPFSAATFADWIAFCDVQSATQICYNKAIENFANYIRDNNISEPCREDIISYREWLLADGYKVSSVRLYLTICKKFFKWLSSKGLFLNVADGVKLPAMPTDVHSRDSLTLEESRQAISSFTGKSEKALRDRCIMSLMIGAGLRSIEICRLDLGDVEKRRGQWFIKVHGKARGGKVDSVALSGALKKTIDDYLKVRPEGKKGSPMFISTSSRNRGARLETQTVSRLAKKTFANIGIESDRITAHSCRHTHATLALEAGVSLRDVSKNLRHRSIMTTEIYLHDNARYANRSVQTVSDLIFVA